MTICPSCVSIFFLNLHSNDNFDVTKQNLLIGVQRTQQANLMG